MTRAEVRHARRALEMLSQETGGLAFFPKSIDQVDQIAAEVARAGLLSVGRDAARG